MDGLRQALLRRPGSSTGLYLTLYPSGSDRDSRLLAFDDHGVTFRWKGYRASGKTRYKAMTLSADEFIRRFLFHVLPSGFHRIRHCGLLANGDQREHLAQAHELLGRSSCRDPSAAERGGIRRERSTRLRLPALRRHDRVVEIFAPHARSVLRQVPNCRMNETATPTRCPLCGGRTSDSFSLTSSASRFAANRLIVEFGAAWTASASTRASAALHPAAGALSHCRRTSQSP